MGGKAPMSESESADSCSDASSVSVDEPSASDHEGVDESSGDEEEAFDRRLDALIRAEAEKM